MTCDFCWHDKPLTYHNYHRGVRSICASCLVTLFGDVGAIYWQGYDVHNTQTCR